MKNPKGLIVTIIIVALPIVWLAIQLNTIDKNYGISGDAIKNTEDQINSIINDELNNAQVAETTPSGEVATDVSGDAPSSIYGDPISKLIEGAKINATAASIYAEPDESSSLVSVVYKDTIVTVQDYANGWSNIKVGDFSGWIKTELVTKPDEGGSTGLTSAVGHKAKILAGTLNVRDKANGDVIDQINKDETVNIIGANDNESWYQIQYGTKSGWITSNKEYVQVQN